MSTIKYKTFGKRIGQRKRIISHGTPKPIQIQCKCCKEVKDLSKWEMLHCQKCGRYFDFCKKCSNRYNSNFHSIHCCWKLWCDDCFKNSGGWTCNICKTDLCSDCASCSSCNHY